MFSSSRSQKKAQGKNLANARKIITKVESDDESNETVIESQIKSVALSKLSFHDEEENVKAFEPNKKKDNFSKMDLRKEEEAKNVKFNRNLQKNTNIIKPSDDPSFIITVKPISIVNKPKMETKETPKLTNDESVWKDLDAPIDGDENTKINIPDANAIFAARKKRESVRKLTSNDYIPIASNDTTSNQNGNFSSSRLVREDTGNSDSEDDLTETPKETLRESVQKTIEENQIINSDQSSTQELNSEDDEELMRWETQQMSKGVRRSSVAQNQAFGPNAPAYIQSNISTNLQSQKDPHKPQFSLPSICIEDIISSVNSKMIDQKSVLDKNASEAAELNQNIVETQNQIANLENLIQQRRGAFEFLQYVKCYLSDLIDCVNDKMPIISKCEDDIFNIVKLHIKAAENERLQKVGQLDELVNSYNNGENVQSNDCRNLIIEVASKLQQFHSNDDQSLSSLTPQLDEVKKVCEHLFDDASPEFYEIEKILKPFKQMKFELKESYKEAFINLSLHTLLAPFIRLHLITWCPLTCPESIKQQDWFRSIVKYSFEQKEYTSETIDDYSLLLNIYDIVISTKLTRFVECWDCISSKQTLCLRNHILFILQSNPEVKEDSKNYLTLFHAICNRMLNYANTLYVPLLPPRLLEDEQSGAILFLSHQITTCLMFVENILLWRNVVDDNKLKQIVVDQIINRCILLGLTQIPDSFLSLTFCTELINIVPLAWLKINANPANPTNSQSNKSLPIFIAFIKQLLEQLHAMKSSPESGDSNRTQRINEGIITANTILQKIS